VLVKSLVKPLELEQWLC